MRRKVAVAAIGLAAYLVAQAGPPAGDCPTDVNQDAVVDTLDFLAVLADWGPCPSPVRWSMQTTPMSKAWQLCCGATAPYT